LTCAANPGYAYRMRKRTSLIWQLYPAYLILVLAALLATGWYASRSMRDFYLSQIHQNLLNQSQLLRAQFLPLLEPSRHAELDRYCKQAGKQVPTRLTIILPNGTVVGDSEARPSQMENHGDRPEVLEALNGTKGSATRFSDTLGRNMMYVALPIQAGSTLRGIVRVSIAIDEIDTQLRKLQFQFLLGGIIIAVVVSIACLLISRRITRPMETMRRSAERFAHGDLSHRVHPPDTFELASLADAINQMAKELEGRIQTVINQRNETQAVFSSMVEGVVALDPEAQIMDLNTAAARLLNRTKEALRGRSIQEVMRNLDLHRMVQITMVDGTQTEGDITLYQDGEQTLSIRCTPLTGTAGESLGIVLVMNDVTQFRRLENMRTDFAANVSHEIKTPLTAIQGFVETLANGSVDDSVQARRFLDIIQKHVHRLSSIIDDLMQLSRLEQDNQTIRLRCQISHIAERIDAAVQLCGKMANEKKITLEINADPGLKANIDPDMIEQALINLIDNAVKYSPEDSTILIHADIAERELWISVQDQGHGIAHKHLPRLFERFYRVDKARSRNMGGTGLGLAIVKHIIQAHGGQVTVESVQGEGSTFTLHLPI